MKQIIASRRKGRRGKVRVGPGLRKCESGYETNIFLELRVEWRGISAWERGGRTWVCQGESRKQNLADTRKKKREKARVGPGLI